jgi:predicted nucleic acid-binding protein
VILYADASALVKRYVSEAGSAEIIALTNQAVAVATAVISRAEVAAALARSVRQGVLQESGGRRAQRKFARDWPDIVRVPVTEALVLRAESTAWEYGLRGYDAVQLAAALTWRESIGVDVTLATFDRQLWEAAPDAGLQVWPNKLAR